MAKHGWGGGGREKPGELEKCRCLTDLAPRKRGGAGLRSGEATWQLKQQDQKSHPKATAPWEHQDPDEEAHLQPISHPAPPFGGSREWR